MSTVNKPSSMAEARYDSALANSFTIDEVVEIIKSNSYTKALTLYYKDSLGNIGLARISAPRHDSSIDDKLLFFNFEPENTDEDTKAARAVKETVFLKDTYGELWFLCDPNAEI